MTPRVSILVMSHNYGRFLGECLDSLAAQTYRGFEVLVINPESEDDTRAVALRYVKRYEFIRYSWVSNYGLSTCRNNGVLATNGEYVMMLDADDKLEPTYLEKVVRHAAPGRLVCAGLRMFGDDNKVCYPREDFTTADLICANQFYCTALFYRNDFNAVGGYDPMLDQLGCEDWELWIRMYKHGCRLKVVREPLFHYRIHKDSHTATCSPAREAARRAYIREKHRA